MKANANGKPLKMKSKSIPYDLWRCGAQYCTDLMFTAFLCLTLAGYFYKTVPELCSKAPALHQTESYPSTSDPHIPCDGNAADEASFLGRSYLWGLICSSNPAKCPANASDAKSIVATLLWFGQQVYSWFVQVCSLLWP